MKPLGKLKGLELAAQMEAGQTKQPTAETQDFFCGNRPFQQGIKTQAG